MSEIRTMVANPMVTGCADEARDNGRYQATNIGEQFAEQRAAWRSVSFEPSTT